MGYPDSLHDLHNGLPFLAEQMDINKVKKLTPNLGDKYRYVVHIRVLDQALKHGLFLERGHRFLKFQQSSWLKPYIELNTRLKTSAVMTSRKTFLS